jgi:hypothetical protein
LPLLLREFGDVLASHGLPPRWVMALILPMAFMKVNTYGICRIITGRNKI